MRDIRHKKKDEGLDDAGVGARQRDAGVSPKHKKHLKDQSCSHFMLTFKLTGGEQNQQPSRPQRSKMTVFRKHQSLTRIHRQTVLTAVLILNDTSTLNYSGVLAKYLKKMSVFVFIDLITWSLRSNVKS